MRRLKKMAAVITATCLMGTACAVPAAAEQVTEAVTESTAAREGTEAGENADLVDEMLQVLDKIPADQVAAAVAPYVPGISEEEIQGYIEMVIALMENEDFRSLMSYEEVQDLAVYTVENLANMAADDPELTRKVLETLEVNETFITVILTMIDHREEIEEALKGLAELEQNEDVQKLFGLMAEMAANEELKTELENLQAALQ
ncbi:MAG: hypothetical protein J6S83_12935 [Lachnospiraceae bacterium]|nr:hypothetical protein [Lachnospiraceae bacterium]